MTDHQFNPSEFYRFQIYLGQLSEDNRIEKTKSVGLAYLRSGQSMYTLKLWTHTNDKFYLLPSKDTPSKYLVFTREPNRKEQAKSKYFWNIVGNGTALANHAVIRLDFDLLHCPLYVSLFPETSTKTNALNDPENIFEAA